MSIKRNILTELYSNKELTGEVMKAIDIVSKYNIDLSYAYKILKEFNSEESVEEEFIEGEYEKASTDYRDNSAELEVNSLTIYTLEQALEIGKVDMSIWEVDRYVQNSWQVTMKGPDKNPIKRTNYQVKVWLRRKKSDFIQSAIKELIDDIDGIRLNFTVNPDRSNSEFAGEMALYDAHFGKFAWHDETLMGNWDTEICKAAYLEGCEKGLQHIIPYNPAKIYFVFGNDFMHFENTFATTPIGGHSLDVDGRLPKVARKAMESVIEAINMCRSVAPVEVKWIPGNHDMHASFWLSLVLEAMYKNDKYVTVDNTPSNKKAVLWGNLLVGWIHDASGRKMNPTINLLPQYWPELWGQSKYRELHTGHKHKKVQTKTMPVDTIGGTIIRQIPSLSSIDFWHADNVFVDAVPAGECLLWSKNDGVVGHYTSNIRPAL